MSELRTDIERPIAKIASIICDGVTASGMSKDDVDDLKEAFRELVVAIKHRH